jgi:hypothetical protein
MSRLEDNMRSTAITTTFVLIAAGALRAQHEAGHTNMKGSAAASALVQTKIQQAMRAAPADISGKATIMDWPEKNGMPMKQLRAGTNGWTCMPSSPAPPDGAGREDPMCADQRFSALLEAWTTKSEPRLNAVGIAYMLQGDKGASNTDPFAMARTTTNAWVVSPSHVMVAVPDSQQLDAFPTDPHSGGPWVMWKGTKYAHLMVPTAAMPKPTAGVKPTPSK